MSGDKYTNGARRPMEDTGNGEGHGGIAVELRLAPEQVDLIAARVAELLAPGERVDSPTWLDTAGAAAHLATTRGRIHDLVQLGKLRPRRDGRRLLFRREELDAYLEESA